MGRERIDLLANCNKIARIFTRDARCYFVVFRSSFSVLNKNGNFKTLILIWASF